MAEKGQELNKNSQNYPTKLPKNSVMFPEIYWKLSATLQP